ncbi:amino acid adenylation domain-containing protein [Lentzea fradiae]|uniref:Amino acid adenylation domain-containing protein n=1 Tax=Lentzea fradiae TaxID=200378 RepID=A0A1G8BD89_9PSEU|nr:non-ribosomal peptide synthetase [Lentzea fradiae]SDH31195.1 amino acid adenylation domain-containing protein [Lentzea fradiae]
MAPRDSAPPLVARLGELAERRPGDLAYRYLTDEPGASAEISYRRLADAVAETAASLAPAGRGARVVLSLPPGIAYVTAFLGCLAAGVVAVPLQPRPGLRTAGAGLSGHPLAVDCGAVAALTADGLVELDTPRQPRHDRVEDVAFLQYTSGSTGTPKGVVVTHANLAHNLGAIRDGMSIGRDDHILGWLPPYHDMGLIGGVLEPLWAGVPGTLMPPQAFARRPLTWLEAIAEHRATVSGGPNFAFDMCVDRTTPEQRAALDLSCWQVAFTGSEPVRPATLRRFAEAFAPAGFRREALYPCYGLAESTLIVSGGRRGEGLRTARHPADDVELTGCGTVLGGQELKIADPETGAALPPGATGEVLVRGGSVTSGYWGRPDATEQAFTPDGWLRTGDLGLVLDGELCVHGRRKDSVVIRGRNLFPEDVEEAVRAADPVLRGTAAAAFGVDTDDGERLVVVVEIPTGRDDADETRTALAAAVRAAVTAATGVNPAAVAFARRGGLPRTTSGKVRRGATRAAYLGGALRLLAEDRTGTADGDGTALPPMLTARSVHALDPGERTAALTASLRAWLAAATGVAAHRVDPSRSLLAAGVDSLLLAQLQGDIAARLGIRLPLAALAEAESLDALGNVLADLLPAVPAGPATPDRAKADPATAVSASAVPVAVAPAASESAADAPAPADPASAVTGSPAELTPAQVAAWYQEQAHPGTTVNVLSRAFRAGGPVDVPLLEATLRHLARRHPALRTALDVVDGVPTGRLLPPTAVRVSVVDSSGWSPSEVDAELDRVALAPFDLAAQPLVRAAVLRRAEGDLLVLAAHHAAVDLWSASLLLAEFDVVHRALAAGTDPGLPPVPAAARSGPADPERSRRWWRDALGTEHPVPALPEDRPRPGGAVRATALVSRALPDLTAKAVRDLAAGLGVSPFSLLLAGWKAVLFGHDPAGPAAAPITVGAPASCRTDPRSRAVVGFLANPLPLRTEVSGSSTFTELAVRVHGTVLAALDHQELPFSTVVRETGASRPDGRTPLFDALFVLHQPPGFAPPGTAAMALGLGGTAFGLGTLALRSVPLPSPDSPVGVTLEIDLGEEETAVALRYAREVFAGSTAGSLLDEYVAVLRAVLADPGARVAELLGSPDPAPLAGPAVDGQPDDVVARILAHARTTPDAIAVRQGEHVLSYRGLVEAGGGLARRLRDLGVGPEALVGIALPRTPGLLVALLAVLQAGGAYFPLDVTLPEARRRALLEQTRPVVVITSAGDLLPAEVPRLVPEAPQAPADPVNHLVHPGQLAYVLFTSGSTGRPKSVALTRGGLAALAEWAVNAHAPAEMSSVLAGTPLVFDLSVFELLVTLAAGGTVVLAEHTLDLPRLREREHVTLLNTVPSVAAELLTRGLPGGVRTANLAGEPLPLPLVRDLAAAGVDRVVNLYGPAEDTTYSTTAEIDPVDGGPVAIGRPLPRCGAHVVTAAGRFVGSAAPGELLLTGPKLARGYLGAPGLTAQRFVADPGGEPGARAYRTGDRVRSRHDGELLFLGRGDRQVKLRGVRIEPAEVESVLARCRGVREVAVRVHHAGRPDAALVAYYAGEATAEEVRGHAARELPSALVPRQYVTVHRLPRTASDKLDRDALDHVPAPGPPKPAARAMTPAERLVAEVWSAVLGAAEHDPDADFFLRGGHSLLATRLLAALETRTGVRVPLGGLFARPTIAGLAEQLADGTAVPAGPAAPGTTGSSPLSPTQERFWLIQALDPVDTSYTVAGVLRLHGPLDTARLERAFTAVVARHEGLRTRFTTAEGEVRQEVLPAGPVALPVSEVDEEGARAVAAATARTPFDLTAGPAWRARLLRTAPGEHRLVFAAHHIICDGWSLELLARDLGAAYTADSPGDPAPSFAAWAGEQWRRWTGDDGDGLAWWRGRLAGLPDLRLPADRVREPGAPRTAAVVRTTLPASTTAALDVLCARERTTRFAALTALLTAVLAIQSGQDEFGIGTPVSGRTTAAEAEVFGCVANTVVLRADLTGRPTFRVLLRRTWTQIRDAVTHQDVPFARVVRDLAAGGSDGNPLFQVMVADQPRGVTLTLEGVRCELEPLDNTTAKFDLSVLLGAGAEPEIAFEYDTTLFDEAAVRGVATRLGRLAAAVAADPDVVPTGAALIDPGERAELLRWGDGGPVPRLGATFLHEIVLAQAARTPDAVAVTARDGALSYGALAARVHRLAVGLRHRGIGAEDRVALCHERTSSLVVALLGVLAAGAAYLPVRLTDPAERRAEVLADAGVRLVLCDPETSTWLDTWDVPLATVDEVVAEAPAGALPPPLVNDSQLAYVLYTSGSTGKPKGVAVTHRGALARIVWARTSFTERELAGVLAATSLGFDLSLFELLAPLAAGGAAVLAENVLELPVLPDRARISMVTAVPSSMAAVLDLGGWPESVRTIGLGGEPLPAPLAARARALAPERAVNLYGTTEDSFCSTWTTLVDDDVTVGRPLPGTTVGVVDAGLDPVPPGTPGDVVVAGVGVSRGYLGRPGLTAAAYRPDPAGPPGSRRYLTGDRGRWTPRGLRMAGRRDDQVKIRGHRVELGEVEAALRAVDGVAEAAALVVASAAGPRLVGYVRHTGDGPVDPGRLRAALRRTLPDYMVPSAFAAVPAMPRTPSGKLDRAALARVPVGGPGEDAAEGPRPGTETEIAEVWRELLGLPAIPRSARFFDLGGDSLLAARMTTRVNSRLGTDLPIRVVFEDDRLTSLAAHADRKDTR